MNKTTNYNLNLPEVGEFYDVNLVNENTNKIDKVLGEFADGTTPVGDTLKLGGKNANAYNLGEIRTSEKTLDTLGSDYSIPTNWTYIGTITPTEKFSDAGWLMGGGRFTVIGIFYDGYIHGVQTIFGGAGIKQRECNAGTWGEWKLIGTDLANYLLKSGGIVPDIFQIQPMDENGKYVTFQMSVDNGFKVRYKDGSTGDILSTANKPSGTYTGNGSATSRTIVTGGVGRTIAITSDNGTVFVSGRVALGVTTDGTLQGLKKNAISFSGSNTGDIVLATDSALLNASGVNYYYQVL